MIDVGEVLKARHRIQAHVHNTPLMVSETLSRETGATIYVKLESLQKTGAFKVRGIYNRVLSDTANAKTAGYITASSGNHGLGLAYVSRELGLKSTIVVPEYTPKVKVAAIEREGAEIVLHGKNWNDSHDFARRLADDKGYSFIHPFEDDAVINGQGTIGLEILEIISSPTYFLASIGGGSMIASNSLVFKDLSPKTKVVGLQTFGADAMYQSIHAGKLIQLAQISSSVESFATKQVSQKTFDITRHCVDEILRLNDSDCIAASLFMLERANVLLELSASICVAALLNKSMPLKPKDTVVLVLCGGNFDLMKLAEEIQSRKRT